MQEAPDLKLLHFIDGQGTILTRTTEYRNQSRSINRITPLNDPMPFAFFIDSKSNNTESPEIVPSDQTV